MPSAIHQIALAKIMRAFPGTKTRGFLREVRKALDDELPEADGISIIPDAFLIEAERNSSARSCCAYPSIARVNPVLRPMLSR